MPETAVRGEGVTVVRGGNEILHAVDFTVAAGVITGLLGPSGSGKTTLMRSIVGTQIIRSGTVTVLGRSSGAASLRHEIGYASQDAAIYDDLTIAENLRYFAAAVRADSSDVERVIDYVRLGEHARQLARDLSGGERSRLNLAAALLGQPRLLVLDEPTVGLDPVLREELWTLFHDLADAGITLLVSSHVMDEADRCSELLLLRNGAVLTHDTPAGLKQRTGTDDLDQAFLRLIGEAA
jgi:ABC-2 type transport system ATP-binding protein